MNGCVRGRGKAMRGSWVRSERGVALPLALVGLVTVTLIVSAALVTASTEWVMSRAHREATEALYTAEGGLNAFLADRGADLAVVVDTASYRFSPAAGGAEVAVQAVLLGEREAGEGVLLRYFSVQASPAARGRGVAALVMVEMAADSVAGSVERVSMYGWQELTRR